MEKNARIYVAGHRGMVGSAIVRQLEKQGYTHIITRTSSEVDLRNQQRQLRYLHDLGIPVAKVGTLINRMPTADRRRRNEVKQPLDSGFDHASLGEGNRRPL